MSRDTRSADEILGDMADSNPGLMEEIVGQHVQNVESSGLNAREHALVRLASLVSIGAPAASFAFQVSVAREAGVSDDDITGVLVAVAPTAGFPRVVAAAPEVMRAGHQLSGAGAGVVTTYGPSSSRARADRTASRRSVTSSLR